MTLQRQEYTYTADGGAIPDSYHSGLKQLEPWLRGANDAWLYCDDVELLDYAGGTGAGMLIASSLRLQFVGLTASRHFNENGVDRCFFRDDRNGRLSWIPMTTTLARGFKRAKVVIGTRFELSPVKTNKWPQRLKGFDAYIKRDGGGMVHIKI